jgi:hypothetical protein
MRAFCCSGTVQPPFADGPGQVLVKWAPLADPERSRFTAKLKIFGGTRCDLRLAGLRQALTATMTETRRRRLNEARHDATDESEGPFTSCGPPQLTDAITVGDRGNLVIRPSDRVRPFSASTDEPGTRAALRSRARTCDSVLRRAVGASLSPRNAEHPAYACRNT